MHKTKDDSLKKNYHLRIREKQLDRESHLLEKGKVETRDRNSGPYRKKVY